MKSKARQAEHALFDAFLRCRSYLVRIIGGVVEPHDIEDIVQETFLRSYEASSKSQIRYPRAFMAKTATNLALNWVAKADQRLTDRIGDFANSTVSTDTDSTEDRVALEQRLFLFCRAAQQMPLQCRRAFILKKVYGLRRKEIAKYMGISESTVQNHVAKGTLMCAEYMEEHGMSMAERGNSCEKERHG